MKLREFIKTAEQTLGGLYSKEEAHSIAELLVEGTLSMSYTRMVLGMDCDIDEQKLRPSLCRLEKGEPIQYVLGRAQFLDYDFHVGEGVLIPRPETEDLVLEAEKYLVKSGSVLDVCTGSGVVAISLFLRHADQHISAFDISSQALGYALKNASALGAGINLMQRDALHDFSSMGTFDVIVSNPPYVPVSDFSSIHASVKDYEPQMAIFVKEDDPLVFYRSIARSAKKMLPRDGVLLFEIYESMGRRISEMLLGMNFWRVEIKKDRFLKDRIVVAWN